MFFAALVLAAPVQAPAVHTVDDTLFGSADFLTIQDAVDAAADGDTILVAEGSYAGFSIDGKALAVTADNAATVEVTGLTRVANVPAGEQVLLRKIFFVGRDEEALVAEQVDGTVWIEECSVRSEPAPKVYAPGKPAIRLDDVADARLLRSGVVGGDGTDELFIAVPAQPGAPALRCEDARAILHDCVLQGGEGGDAAILGFLDGADGGHGVVLSNGRVSAWGTSLSAGDGGYGDYYDGPGGLTCGQPGAGGNAIEVVASAGPGSIELLAATLEPGAGGDSGKGFPFGTCSDGPDGVSLAGAAPGDLVEIPGPHRSHWTKSPADDGTSARLFLQAEPGDLALLAVGAPTPPTPVSDWIGSLFLSPVGLQVLFAGSWTPGVLQPLLIPVPQQPAGFETTRLFTQGAVLTPEGEVRLLHPASLVVVDDGIGF